MNESRRGAYNRNRSWPNALRAVRVNASLTQQQLAQRIYQQDKMFLSHVTISEIERGVRKPSRQQVLAIARACGLNDMSEHLQRLLLSFGYSPETAHFEPIVNLATLMNQQADSSLSDIYLHLLLETSDDQTLASISKALSALTHRNDRFADTASSLETAIKRERLYAEDRND